MAPECADSIGSIIRFSTTSGQPCCNQKQRGHAPHECQAGPTRPTTRTGIGKSNARKARLAYQVADWHFCSKWELIRAGPSSVNAGGVGSVTHKIAYRSRVSGAIAAPGDAVINHLANCHEPVLAKFCLLNRIREEYRCPQKARENPRATHHCQGRARF